VKRRHRPERPRHPPCNGAPTARHLARIEQPPAAPARVQQPAARRRDGARLEAARISRLHDQVRMVRLERV